MIIKKCETCGIKYKNCEYCLKDTNVKDDLIVQKCSFCNRNCQINFAKNLKNLFVNA